MGHDLTPLSSHDVFRRVSQFRGGDRRISSGPSAEEFGSAHRAVVAFECGRPTLGDFPKEMG